MVLYGIWCYMLIFICWPGLVYFHRLVNFNQLTVIINHYHTVSVTTIVTIYKHSYQLPNLEEMFPRYYMDSDVISGFKNVTTHLCVIRLYSAKELR